MPKKEKIEPSNDLVRETILKHLYDSWKNARGMESHKLRISQIYLELKRKGIERKYVVRNLTYLIETKWVNEEIEEVSYYTGNRSIPNKRKIYNISKDGIDFFEGNSKFQRINSLAGINMNNIIDSVIVIGNNNIVRNEYKGVSESLEKLGKQIRMNSGLSDEQKINYQAEIDTIQSQLKKSKPDKSIIEKSWDFLKEVATINGIVGLYNQTKQLIDSLLNSLF